MAARKNLGNYMSKSASYHSRRRATDTAKASEHAGNGRYKGRHNKNFTGPFSLFGPRRHTTHRGSSRTRVLFGGK